MFTLTPSSSRLDLAMTARVIILTGGPARATQCPNRSTDSVPLLLTDRKDRKTFYEVKAGRFYEVKAGRFYEVKAELEARHGFPLKLKDEK